MTRLFHRCASQRLTASPAVVPAEPGLKRTMASESFSAPLEGAEVGEADAVVGRRGRRRSGGGCSRASGRSGSAAPSISVSAQRLVDALRRDERVQTVGGAVRPIAVLQRQVRDAVHDREDAELLDVDLRRRATAQPGKPGPPGRAELVHGAGEPRVEGVAVETARRRRSRARLPAARASPATAVASRKIARFIGPSGSSPWIQSRIVLAERAERAGATAAGSA